MDVLYMVGQQSTLCANMSSILCSAISSLKDHSAEVLLGTFKKSQVPGGCFPRSKAMASASGMSSSPVTTPESNAPQANRVSGFFGRFAKSHVSVVPTGVVVAAATGSAVAAPSVAPVTPVTPTTPVPVQAATPTVQEPVLAHEAEILKLKAESAQLRARNLDLTQQSELNQEMLQECISSSNSEVEALAQEAKKLQQLNACSNLTVECLTDTVEKLKETIEDLNKPCNRCKDLTTQSEFNQHLVQAYTSDMQDKNSEITNLKCTFKAEISNLHSQIQTLESRLESQVNEGNLLQYVGFTSCPTGDPTTHLLRIESLEAENAALSNKLSAQVTKTKALALDLGREVNDLTTLWRNAHSDTKYRTKQLSASENLFRALHAEFQLLQSELDLERSANKKMLAPVYHAKSKSLSHTDLARHNALLFAQLSKAEALASERQICIDDLKAQHARLDQSAKAHVDECVRQWMQIDTLHAEAKTIRTAFEEKILERDARIVQLRREVGIARQASSSGEGGVSVGDVEAKVKAVQAECDKRVEILEEVLEEKLKDAKVEEMEREGLSGALLGVVGWRGKGMAVLATSSVVDVQTLPRLAPSRLPCPTLSTSSLVTVHTTPRAPTPSQRLASTSLRPAPLSITRSKVPRPTSRLPQSSPPSQPFRPSSSLKSRVVSMAREEAARKAAGRKVDSVIGLGLRYEEGKEKEGEGKEGG